MVFYKDEDTKASADLHREVEEKQLSTPNVSALAQHFLNHMR